MCDKAILNWSILSHIDSSSMRQFLVASYRFGCLQPLPFRSTNAPTIISSAPKRFASSKRWQTRQLKDRFTREAAVKGLKSRAAFKIMQIDEKYRIFHSGQTIVDLGYAPGSWSQVACTRTQPDGRVVGVDIIPAQPPRGVSTIQGNFLDPSIQDYILKYLSDTNRGRPHSQGTLSSVDAKHEILESTTDKGAGESSTHATRRTVDVVLSDMSAPWYQTSGFWKRSLSNPYDRMMNTSGMTFRDHAGSMDLCRAALQFGFEVLKTGGHFVCKFYQGAEDKAFEKQLKGLFQKVHRLKPESSRNESKEAYFIGLSRREHATRNEVFSPPH
ncbi:ribosomal RNA large subunit methyltransferase J [Aspergillus avenaceus]|uniref:rRNA methyltransferase 2, mitochondrial n=1 Tax=Aspergillus avenaceus TaxID=36643 RepID=A0A5N6TJK4_ASPAV|nr:ribosomal RNA large subunit methyltransferase J [Aspergillus avenaceus]